MQLNIRWIPGRRIIDLRNFTGLRVRQNSYPRRALAQDWKMDLREHAANASAG